MPLKNKYSGKTEPAEVILDKFILTMAIQIYIVFLWIKWLNVNYLDIIIIIIIIIIINYTSIKINSKLHLIIIIQQKVWLNVKKRLLFVTLNRIVLISSLHNTTYILHYLFISLFCTIYHVPYATLSIFILLFFIYIFLFNVFFFFTCPYLYICNSCIFVCIYVCIYILFVLICIFAFYC